MLQCRLSWYRLLVALACTLLLLACAGPQSRLPPAEIAAASVPPHRDTTIALLGGTGFAGGYILQRALAEGYRVRVLSRSPEKLAYLGARVTVVAGDALDPAVIDTLLEDSDAVISAIGPSKNGGAAANSISTTVTGHVIATMQRLGLRRYIVVSGAAVELPGDRRDLSGWWMRQLVRLRYGDLLRARQEEYALLSASGLDWTLVRCPLIDAEPARGSPEVSLETPPAFHVRAGELAEFIVAQLQSGRYAREGPFVGSR